MRTAIATALLFAFVVSGADGATETPHNEQRPLQQYNLVPYPQRISIQSGQLVITLRPEIVSAPGAGPKQRLGAEQLRAFFQKQTTSSAGNGQRIQIILGSLEGEQRALKWLSSREAQVLQDFNSQGYILRIGEKQIVIMGRTGQGTLYGVQTLLQMLSQSRSTIRLPRLEIEDYPEVPNRYVDVTFAWYAHYYTQTFGYGTQLWTEQQWRWFIDWCLRHKINGIDLCIYGYWPFTFPKYPESILANISVRTYDAKTGRMITVRLSHPNIEHEFLPALIRYAQARGIRVNAYIGLNTFNGGYVHQHPEALPFSTEQWESLVKGGYFFPKMDYMLDLSNEAARQYLRDSLRRIMQMGFDGITFEMIELPSSVCTKPKCISEYWAGYESGITPNSIPKLTPLPVRIRADADILNDLYQVITEVNPHANVGLIYHRIAQLYGWGPETLQNFSRFRGMIPKQVYFLQGPRAPRDGVLKGSEFEKWVKTADPRTYRHSDNIGGDAAGQQRLLYINNDPKTRGDEPVPSLEWAIAQQRAAAMLHLQGASGYGFEWYGEEIYPLILAQYSWRSQGPEGVPDHGFLEYASQSMYGKQVGTLVAKTLALSPPPKDHYPSKWVASADEAVELGKQALDEYSGPEPEYRKSLEQIHTATLRKAGLYEVEKLQAAANSATGSERTKLLQQALTKAEEVGDLMLNGRPRANYQKGYFGRFEIFATIQKIAGELGVRTADKYDVD